MRDENSYKDFNINTNHVLSYMRKEGFENLEIQHIEKASQIKNGKNKYVRFPALNKDQKNQSCSICCWDGDNNQLMFTCYDWTDDKKSVTCSGTPKAPSTRFEPYEEGAEKTPSVEVQSTTQETKETPSVQVPAHNKGFGVNPLPANTVPHKCSMYDISRMSWNYRFQQLATSHVPEHHKISYLVSKKMHSVPTDFRELDDVFLCPIYRYEDNTSELAQFVGTQRVYFDVEKNKFEKKFSYGLEMKKSNPCFYMFYAHSKEKEKECFYIAEGVADGYHINRVTGRCVVVSFGANNLEAVAKMIKERAPNNEVRIAADNDIKNKNNAGMEYAKEASRSTGYGIISFPENKDASDIVLESGDEELKKLLDDERNLIFTSYSDDEKQEAKLTKKLSKKEYVRAQAKRVANAGLRICKGYPKSYIDIYKQEEVSFACVRSLNGFGVTIKDKGMLDQTKNEDGEYIIESFDLRCYNPGEELTYTDRWGRKIINKYTKPAIQSVNYEGGANKDFENFNDEEIDIDDEIDKVLLINREDPKKCSIVKDFLIHLIGMAPKKDEDEHAMKGLLWWVAKTIVHPAEKIIWSPILYGTTGVGKSVLGEIIIRMLEAEYDIQHGVQKELHLLSGEFNSFYEKNCFIFAEEMHQDEKDKKKAARNFENIMALPTAVRNNVNEKFEKGRSSVSYANFMFATNYENSIILPKNDRRFVMINCRDRREEIPSEEREDLFKPLWNMATEKDDKEVIKGLGELRYFFSKIVCSKEYKIHVPPVTEATLIKKEDDEDTTYYDQLEADYHNGVGIYSTMITRISQGVTLCKSLYKWDAFDKSKFRETLLEIINENEIGESEEKLTSLPEKNVSIRHKDKIISVRFKIIKHVKYFSEASIGVFKALIVRNFDNPGGWLGATNDYVQDLHPQFKAWHTEMRSPDASALAEKAPEVLEALQKLNKEYPTETSDNFPKG